MGAKISASRMPRHSCCGAKVVVDAQASCRHRAGIVTLVVMVSSSLIRRRLCRCRNSVVALVAMESLPLPMRRRLAVVDDDGNNVAGSNINDVDNDGAMGDDDEDN